MGNSKESAGGELYYVLREKVAKTLCKDPSNPTDAERERIDNKMLQIGAAHALVDEIDRGGGLNAPHEGHVSADLPKRYDDAKKLLQEWGLG